MGKVLNRLLDENNQQAVLADCLKLVNSEVASKKGASGLMIKAGYKAFRAVRPGIVTEAMKGLLPHFAQVLDGHYTEYEAAAPGQNFSAWLSDRSGQVAEDLLAVTDQMVEQTDKRAVTGTYNRLRGMAIKNVAQAVPAVGELVESHLK
ncbi:MAG: hypothetical protein ABIJ95_04175 [Pseudomonadota bacterium]